MTQPEALRLAEFLEMHWCNVDMPEAKAAAELRRLHAQRDALLEALKIMRDKYGEYACRACDRADAAIAKAEEV